jgi:type 1 fimbria pilin
MFKAKPFGIALCAAILMSLVTDASAAPKKYKITGKVQDGAGYRVLLIQKNGNTKEVTLGNSGAFSFKNLSKTQLKSASLQLVGSDGSYFGPLVLGGKANKVSLSFSADSSTPTALALGQVQIKDGFARLKKFLNKKFVSKANVTAVAFKPEGAGNLGLAAPGSTSALTFKLPKVAAQELANPGLDSDLDGLPSVLDADDDGDGILDAVDPDSEGLDVPMTALNLDFRRSINSHVRLGLSDQTIDAVISGENAFSLSLFFSQPQGSTVDGGYVVCPDSLVYCRQTTPTAFYGGVSESTTEFRNKFWTELLNADGYPRMENLSISGSFQAIVASIQPRVGRDQFRPGDILRAVLTNGTSVVSSKTLAVAPYFVSVPAIKEYDAGLGTVQVDYASVNAESGSIPGVSEGDPIVLSGTGELTVSFWRPQRAAIRSDESGYLDLGGLRYGLVIGSAQATCAGLYSEVSSELVEDTEALGNGGSPFANQGANLDPYTDSTTDRAANVSNVLSFKVNLKDCLARAGLSAGSYGIALEASGPDVTGGRITAAQGFYVQIP